MAKKIYISPSDQTESRYAWGNANTSSPKTKKTTKKKQPPNTAAAWR